MIDKDLLATKRKENVVLAPNPLINLAQQSFKVGRFPFSYKNGTLDR